MALLKAGVNSPDAGALPSATGFGLGLLLREWSGAAVRAIGRALASAHTTLEVYMMHAGENVCKAILQPQLSQLNSSPARERDTPQESWLSAGDVIFRYD